MTRRSSRRRAASHWLRSSSATSTDSTLRRRFGIQTRQTHQPVDEPAHVLFLDRHRAENLAGDARLFDGAAAQHVDVAADDGQRRAQLVRGVGRELPHALFGVTAIVHGRRDAGRRVVKSGRQRSDFVAAGHDEAALRVVAVGQGAQRIADLVDRPQRLLRQRAGRRTTRARSRPGRSSRRCASTESARSSAAETTVRIRRSRPRRRSTRAARDAWDRAERVETARDNCRRAPVRGSSDTYRFAGRAWTAE